MISTKKAIDDFLMHCRYEKNLSLQTLRFYAIDLQQFLIFLLRQEPYPIEIDKINKIHFKDYLKELSKWKPKTIKRKIATIKALFNYLEYEDVIVVNPLRKIKIKIKEPFILPKALTKTETAQLLQSAHHSMFNAKQGHFDRLEKIRNTAIVELLFATGARVSEVANLKVSDIDLVSGEVYIKGKGNKERIVFVCASDTLATLQEYCDAFQEKIARNGDDLWINRLNKKLSDQSIRIIVRNLTKSAQLNKKVTPHVLRHTFATLLLENGVDIKYIQSLLGHSSIMTTQIYTHVNREKQKQIMEEKHPRKELSLYFSGPE
jgi:integrase/recombinase XerD